MKHHSKRKFMRFKSKPIPRSGSVMVRNKPRVLLAHNEYHSGQAVYRFELGEWVCETASECLMFLRKQTAGAAKLELLRRGFEWEWK